jgi:hypothetical protein
MAQLYRNSGDGKSEGLPSAKLYLVAGGNEGDRRCPKFLIKAGVEMI